MTAPLNGLPAVLTLWESTPPFARSTHDARPQLTVYLPSEEHQSGQALVICPGGGYGMLATPKEGHRIARHVSSQGIAAAVLEYRHAPDRHPIPLIDAQRALRLLRSHAPAWHLDPEQIGILGFSAGGHLAGCAATQAPITEGLIGDAIDQFPCRPDFAVLIYPVVTLSPPHAHEGSRINLLGEAPDPALTRQLSLENAVTPQTPPTLLIHTNEDTAVTPMNSVLLYQALRTQGIPAELHIYEKREHGMGLADNHPWGTTLLQWLQNRRHP